MEGFGEFNVLWETSEGNGNEQAREEAHETIGANVTLEVTSGDEQENNRGASASSRRRQKSRHTPAQIQQLENFFKANPHPDERERTEIGRDLNLEPNQVKFWFQNRRTQLKTQTDRHDNKILKQENDNLRLENTAMKEALRNSVCRNCGGPIIQADRSVRERNLMIENARLKEELNRMTSIIRQLGRPLSSLATESLAGGSSYGGLNPMETGLHNLVSNDPPMMPTSSRSEVGMSVRPNSYLDLASSAMDELMKLGQASAPLWKRNMETGGETLNLEEHVRSFPPLLGMKPVGFVSEASRANALVSLKSIDIVDALLDADRWRDMFAGMIGSSATTEVLSGGGGIGGSRNGVLQMMQAEIQLVSPSVAARVVRFIRYSRQQAEGVWAVVDVSVDAGLTCRRLPSGCILHDMPNGFTQVTWIEHTEYDERPVHHQYRWLLSSGLGFGAQKWICALLRHCECMRAMTWPTELAPNTRRCLKGLAQRMTSIFCAGVCLTDGQRWNLVANEPRIMTRRIIHGHAILAATISVWYPTTHRRLFDLLLTRDLRCVWDVLCHGNACGNIIHFPMSHDDINHPNSISILGSDTMEENPIMVLQETASDMTGSLIVYATVDLATVSVILNNGDVSSAGLVPSGLYIVPGGGAPGGERGSMVTLGFQILLQDMGCTPDTIDTVNNLVSRTVQGIQDIVRSSRSQGG